MSWQPAPRTGFLHSYGAPPPCSSTSPPPPSPHSFQNPIHCKRKKALGILFREVYVCLDVQAHSIARFASPSSYRIETAPGACLISLWFRIRWSPATQAPSLPERLSDPCPLPLFTVNSKAEVRFHLASAEWIAEPVRRKMAVTVTTGPSFLFNPQSLLSLYSVELWFCLCSPQHKNKINRAGELILTSECSRYQFRNLADCLQKIRDMITEASQPAKEPSREDAVLQKIRYWKIP